LFNRLEYADDICEAFESWKAEAVVKLLKENLGSKFLEGN
jgi:hypothetical protein